MTKTESFPFVWKRVVDLKTGDTIRIYGPTALGILIGIRQSFPTQLLQLYVLCHDGHLSTVTCAFTSLFEVIQI